LVTGACGFIGSHLVERLVEGGVRVRAFVYYNSFNRRGWLDTLPGEVLSEIEVVSGDVRDFHCVKKAMEGAEVVFHLAALISIPYSYIAPESYVDTNIKGTLNVLQAGREIGVARLIHTSTSEVYGTAQYVPIDEKHPLQGQSPYAATKIAADMMAQSFHCSYGLPVTVCRPFNTYGPRQSARAIIPTIICQLMSNKTILSLGNLHTHRDFNYVQDTAEGFVKIAEADQAIGEMINIGSGDEISISDLVETIGRRMGREINVEEEERRLRPYASEVYRLCADNRKAKNILGWTSKIDLETGLSKTIEWFERNKDRYKQMNYHI